MKRGLAILLAVFLLAGCAAPEPWQMPVSPYGPGDFQQGERYLQCSAGQAAVGIDVSSHQGEIDWQQVADAGVQYAFIRLGYRGYESGTVQPDSNAMDNLRGAKAAGLLVGAYFFSQAVNVQEAREEAAFAMEQLEAIGVGLELPLVYDWEYVSETARTAQVDRETLTACTLAFCQAVEEGGYRPMIYFNTTQGRELLDLEQLEQYPWWLAKYELSMEFLCRVDLWQYTNQGTVPGIEGKVDVDLMFTEFGLGAQVFGQVS